VPRALYDRLFPYQKTAVKWMWELHCQEAGGIIGDEMGLGKTVQTVAFLAGLHHSGKLTAPVLLLCPATIMAQWVRHFHEWYPPLRVVVVHDSGSHARAPGDGPKASAEKLVRGAFRRGGVVVTTYDHLRLRADLMASQARPRPVTPCPPPPPSPPSASVARLGMSRPDRFGSRAGPGPQQRRGGCVGEGAQGAVRSALRRVAGAAAVAGMVLRMGAGAGLEWWQHVLAETLSRMAACAGRDTQ
jgi:hypothetical protein